MLQYNYGDMLKHSHEFYRSQWVGALPDGYDVPWRYNAFTTEVGPTKLAWGDITGGIMEGREAGGQLLLDLLNRLDKQHLACWHVEFTFSE